jgi:hypothetical protein
VTFAGEARPRLRGTNGEAPALPACTINTDFSADEAN